MDTKQKIDLRKMNRFGVLTVATDRLDRSDYICMTEAGLSPTETFFNRMKTCTYTNGEDCILSMNDDNNLILAHLDNNAIFLLSQNSVLSPREFVNFMINLQECSSEMCKTVQRNNRLGFSDFGLKNLNINFANIELITGMPADIMLIYDKPKENVQNFIGGNTQIKSVNNSQQNTICYKYSSQYGKNLLEFLNEIVKRNPDIRLIMSNVFCQNSPLDLVQAAKDAIGQTYDSMYYKGEELSYVSRRKILEFPNLDQHEKNKILKSFEEHKRSQKEHRINNNTKYKIYPALKYVVENFGEISDVDEQYLLEWYDGDPDIGEVAINYALNSMLMAYRRENDTNMNSPRVLCEVKAYMESLNTKAHDISKHIIKAREAVDREKKNK